MLNPTGIGSESPPFEGFELKTLNPWLSWWAEGIQRFQKRFLDCRLVRAALTRVHSRRFHARTSSASLLLSSSHQQLFSLQISYLA